MQIRHQHLSAYALLEALIGMMIFTIGILGVVALQGNVLSRNMDANFRIKASLMANELISLATADSGNAGCYTLPATGCSSAAASAFMTDWITEVNNNLPGSTTNQPTATLAADRTLTVTLFWQRNQDPILHNYISTTQLESS